jgi:hypothetical protein
VASICSQLPRIPEALLSHRADSLGCRQPTTKGPRRNELEALEREVDGIKTALGTRTIIGKAIGVIIEREGVNETEAFEMLKTMSQHTAGWVQGSASRFARE